MAIKRSAFSEVRRQVPIAPTMIATKSNLVSTTRRSSKPHRDCHRFSAGSSVTHHLCPRMQLAEEIRPLDLFRTVKRGHRPRVNYCFDGSIDVGIGIAKQTASNSVVSKVKVMIPVQIPYFGSDCLLIISGPQLRQQHLWTFRQELGATWDSGFGSAVKLLSGALAQILHQQRLMRRLIVLH